MIVRVLGSIHELFCLKESTCIAGVLVDLVVIAEVVFVNFGEMLVLDKVSKNSSAEVCVPCKSEEAANHGVLFTAVHLVALGVVQSEILQGGAQADNSVCALF